MKMKKIGISALLAVASLLTAGVHAATIASQTFDTDQNMEGLHNSPVVYNYADGLTTTLIADGTNTRSPSPATLSRWVT